MRPRTAPTRCAFLVLSLALFLPGVALAVPIGSLHCNDADGAPRLKGQSVTVAGVVVGQFSTQRNVRLYVQDASGAVCIYGTPKNCVAVGDSVSVTGVITGYGGLTEIAGSTDTPVAIQVLGHAGRAPAPLPLTLAQVTATERSDGCEPNESRLVQVSDVRILSASGEPLAGDAKFGDNTNYRLVSAAGDTSMSVTLRVTDPEGCDLSQSLEGQPIPVGVPVSVVGVISQYAGRSQTHGGYQLLPRGRADIRVMAAKPAPAPTRR